MDQVVWIIYSPEFYIYGLVEFEKNHFSHLQSLVYAVKRKKRKFLKLDCVFVHYFIRELNLSDFYRQCVLKNVCHWKAPEFLMLTSTKKDLIDYKWNERMSTLARERCEVDHAFSWLSTLGGAFSALGDYMEQCAETAGKISIHQFKLAFRIGDPNIQSRCRLYLSLSLIQKKQYKRAKIIIKWEYQRALNQTVIDSRLVKMCKGIWSKLQYEYSLYRNNIRRIKRSFGPL
ncbi:hypothetical protein ABEB36_007820 [Hypothenemus hampei]|uniref:Uncharacterized protein n=1 Tax=Hypothenemus hampei TaxID=57062 RepID=A0ABD1EZ62_HYPHA